jgi:hypothetical protein
LLLSLESASQILSGSSFSDALGAGWEPGTCSLSADEDVVMSFSDAVREEVYEVLKCTCTEVKSLDSENHSVVSLVTFFYSNTGV